MGNKNHLRNRSGRINIANDNHPVIRIFKEKRLSPKTVLEIGCSTGFVLKKINKLTGAKCYGIDISKTAIKEGKGLFKKIELRNGYFEKSVLSKKKYDLIIFGFFLFLTHPENILNLFAKVNNSLKNNSYIIIYDFYNKIYKKKNYKHEKKLKVYRYDYKKIFLSIPNFKLVYIKKIYNTKVKDYLEVSLLKKIKI